MLFKNSIVLCSLGVQQYAMRNAAVHKTTFFELGVYVELMMQYVKLLMHVYM